MNYWNHELLVNAWDYTDPVSEAQADQLQIDMGTKSHQMVISERGRDGEQLIRERKEWQDKTDGLPEVRSTMTRDAMPEIPEPVPQPNENGDDTDDDEQ